MDALQSFIYLTDNLPDWIANVNHLSTQVAERQTEIRNLNRNQKAEEPLRRQRNGSTESLRPKDEVKLDIPAVVEEDQPHTPLRKTTDVGSRRALGTSRKKRKPLSEISGGTAHQRFRTQSMIIVYYDSSIQEGFEALVRNIGSARNNLRKGRTASAFKAKMAAFGIEDSPRSASNGAQMFSPRTTQQIFPKSKDALGAVNPGDVAFDKADKDLETAQSLCEVGAHQFLRDGDCFDEIEGTRVKFESCLRLAKQERKRLSSEEEEAKKLEDAQCVRSAVDQTSNAPKEDKIVKNGASPAKPEVKLDQETIEIDDDSDAGSFHVDLSAFRSTRRV
ncbi:hypothetical protein MMC09_007114 [Bachmanniomyces sp. S44760]|nr:hypothetical protein [Bachmanniomyces sp. S44760]